MKTLFLILSLIWLSACTQSPSMVSLNGKTMGTFYEVKYFNDSSQVKSDDLQAEIETVLKEVNRQMSTYIPTSEISQVNQSKASNPVVISSWFVEVLKYSLQLAKNTGGVFDPTLGPLVNLWGFGPNGQRKVPSQDDIKEKKASVGFAKVHFVESGETFAVTKDHDQTYLDLSASAKGFAVDKVSEFLAQKGLNNHLVNIGGEIRVQGEKSKDEPWRLAIEKPNEDQQQIVQVSFAVKDMSLATSGSYRNFFKEDGKTYSHTIDINTGRPVRHGLVSVSVLAKTCMEADGLATALMAMGPEKAWSYAEQNQLPVYMIISNPESKAVSIKKTTEFVDFSGI